MNIACDTHLKQMTALDVQCHSLMFHLWLVKYMKQQATIILLLQMKCLVKYVFCVKICCIWASVAEGLS